MNCPKCNQPVGPETRFCGSCGTRIEAAAPSMAPPLQPALATAPAGSSAYAAPPGSGTTGTATPGLIARVRNIVLTPRTEWPVIEPESTGIAQLYTGYIVPLSAFAAVLGFIHMSVIGMRLPFIGLVRSPITAGLTTAVLTFVMGLVSLFVVGLIINTLAPTFGGSRDQRQAMKVAAYAFTPGWLSAVLALSPFLAGLLQFAAGCYGIYVLYLGLPVLMRSPRERATGYTASVVVCCILFGVVLAVVFGALNVFGSHAGLLPAATHEQQQAQASQDVGNVIGGMLGTDDKGKAGLGAAINNLAKAGEAQHQQEQAAAAGGTAAAPDSGSAPAADGAAQNPLGAVGGLMNALGGALGGPNRVEPVDYKTLTTLLPEKVAGLPRMNVKGEGKQAIGVKTTNAIADYGNNNGEGGRVHVEIADVSGVSGLMDLANGLVQNETSESSTGFEKDVVLGGRTAHEKYDAQARKGEISMIIAKRFSVDVTGEDLPMSTLEQAYAGINLGALEGMKDQGAKH